MIAWVGEFSLWIGMILAISAMISSLIKQNSLFTARLTALGMIVAVFMIFLAFSCLVYAYAISDFSLKIVALNSHTTKPFIYKISGVWANHEGSMLLWLFVLGLYTLGLILFFPKSNRDVQIRTVRWMGILLSLFGSYILFTSSPFEVITHPSLEGNGLNPMLQDPALAIHPPLLYLGYVGLSVPFALTLASLQTEIFRQNWVQWVRPWVLFTWITLTAGVTLGGLWAYYELGWGGWWYWDPVENAALMPWLLSTGLLHTLKATEQSQTLYRWGVVLTLCAFFFSLLGTFLVRSGILSSVHSFAHDPERGFFIFMILIFLMGISSFIVIKNISKIEETNMFEIVSKESAILLQNIILCVIVMSIFMGTLYPLFIELLTGSIISVGAPFFNSAIVPLAIPLFTVMMGAPLLYWKKDQLYRLLREYPFVITAILLSIISVILFYTPKSLYAAIWLSLSLSVITTSGVMAGQILYRQRRLPFKHLPVLLAHLGVGVVLLGMTSDAFNSSQTAQILSPGQSMELAGHRFMLKGVQEVQGQNYVAEKATLISDSIIVEPEKRFYPVEKVLMSEVGLKRVHVTDFYAVLGDFQGNNRWVIRLQKHPGIWFIWMGAILMILGGCIALILALRKTSKED